MGGLSRPFFSTILKYLIQLQIFFPIVKKNAIYLPEIMYFCIFSINIIY